MPAGRGALVLAFAVACLAGHASPCAAQAAGRGIEFFGCWPRTHLSLETSAELVVQSDVQVDVAVDGAFTFGPAPVAPDAPLRIPLPETLRMAADRTVVATAFRVRSLDPARPISVLLRVPVQAEASDDIARLLPVEQLGTRFVIGAYESALPGEPSFYAIVATQDGTTIDAQVPCTGTIERVVLDVGDAWQAFCQWTDSPPDVTGAVVQSDKPIAILAGCADAYVPSNWLSGDVVVEALAPIVAWGTDWFVPPLPKGPLAVATAHDRVRVVASAPSVLEVEDSAGTRMVTFVREGDWTELELREATRMSCTAPADLFLFATGVEMTDLGDPFMLNVPPVTQWTRAARAHVPEGYTLGSYLTVLADAGDTGGVSVDRVPVTGWQPFPGGTHAWAQVPAAPGEHVVTGPGLLAVLVHGYNDAYAPQPGLGRVPGSFGYPAPEAERPCSVAPRARAPISSCAGTPLDLDDAGTDLVECALVEYRWLRDGVLVPGCDWSPSAECSTTFDATATYLLEARCVDRPGCVGSSAAVVVDLPPPAMVLQPDPVTICAGASVVLEAPLGFRRYDWTSVPDDPGVTPGTSVFETFVVSPDTDTVYTLVATDVRGCTTTDDLLVTTIPDPLPPALGASVRVRRAGDDTIVTWTDLAGVDTQGYEVVVLECALRDWRTACGGRLPDPITIQASPLAAPRVPAGTETLTHAGALQLGDMLFYKVRATSPCAGRPGPTCNPWPAQVPRCP